MGAKKSHPRRTDPKSTVERRPAATGVFLTLLLAGAAAAVLKWDTPLKTFARIASAELRVRTGDRIVSMSYQNKVDR
jgi:hypothetical protein